MNLDRPEISVLLPVYNGDKFLIKSIDSILSQTFENFELIIINDGSNDDSLKIIESFNDRRIKFFHHSENRGITFALNKGLHLQSILLDKIRMIFHFLKIYPSIRVYKGK